MMWRMSGQSDMYDLAFSFAGEHREYVEKTKDECERLGLKVFYDRDKNNEWWGKNFIMEQRKVYGSQTRYFVPFVSTEYLTRPIPSDEFQAAMMTAVRRGDDYILPVLIGDVQVPPELMHSHIHYLRAEDYAPRELAQEMQQRVGAASNAGQQPRDIGEVVQGAVGSNFVGGLTVVVKIDRGVTYEEAEKALQRRGFRSYNINRSEISGQTQLTLSVHVPVDEITASGVPPMNAVKTLRDMADALEDLG